jgi:hypothetical protein
MSLNRNAYRVRTSSALVLPANTRALQPDSYPLAIGYWLLFIQFHHKDTKDIKLGRIIGFICKVDSRRPVNSHRRNQEQLRHKILSGTSSLGS